MSGEAGGATLGALETVLADVPHRRWVFTIPKALRGLFARERSLLALLPRCAFAALRRHLRERAGCGPPRRHDD